MLFDENGNPLVSEPENLGTSGPGAFKLTLNGPVFTCAWFFIDEKVLESISWNAETNHWMERITAERLSRGAIKIDFLREVMRSLQRTVTDAELIVARKWQGPVIVEEGVLHTAKPREIRTSKMVYTYGSLEDMFLDGWRF